MTTRKRAPARPIAAIDCETDPFLRLRHPRPFLWGFYDGERYREFTKTKDLVDFLRPQKLCVYAHNGGKFDYQYLVEWLEPYSEILIINSRLAKFSIGECEFRDSWNILPEKLAKFNIDGHKKKEIDYAKLEKNVREKHMPEIKRYLREDCVVLYKAVAAFRETYGDSLTIAGAAMKVWKGMSDVECPESDAKFYHFLKDCYYGGRVQCFEGGLIEEPFVFCDINSAYPFAMLHDHPISTTYDTVRPSVDDPIINQSLYCVRAISRGAFPWRATHESALEFPCDEEIRTYHVTGWELSAGMDTKTVDVESIVYRADFSRNIDFKKYIMDFYERKKKAEPGSTEYIFAKLFMNSLYGKFAACPEHYCNYGLVPTEYREPAEKDSKLKLGRNVGPWSWVGDLGHLAVMAGREPIKKEKGKRNPNNATHSKYFNVATAASITGCVRARLWRDICAIRKGGGRMLYCDTDSLAFTYPNVELPLRISKDIGDWSLVGHGMKGGIAGKKLYAFRMENGTWKTASKGVRMDADEIMAIAGGATLSYMNPVPVFSPLNRGKGPTFLQRTVSATVAVKSGKTC